MSPHASTLAAWIVAGLALASTGCNSDPEPEAAPDEARPAIGLYHLDLQGKRASQPLAARPQRAGEKFLVEVDVTAIENPELVPIYFEVQLLRADGSTTTLGSFSPFPPDNPGSFLVSAGEAAAEGGTLVVLMRPISENPPHPEAIRATIGKLELRQD